MTTLAALAAIPARASILPRVLQSIRPQVDRLNVYLNGWEEAPSCVRDLADQYHLDPINRGAERKLHWAASCDGVYLSLDDDFTYPPDYVARMREAVDQWGGRAIVTAHGRVFLDSSKRFRDAKQIGLYYRHVPQGRWVNYGGTGVMAWDASRVKLPTEWPLRNILDMQVAIWAQRNEVPMWLIPHQSRWLVSMRTMDPQGIFRSSLNEGHQRRTDLLNRHARIKGWKVYRLDQ